MISPYNKVEPRVSRSHSVAMNLILNARDMSVFMLACFLFWGPEAWGVKGCDQ
jgi:hypothetical protein